MTLDFSPNVFCWASPTGFHCIHSLSLEPPLCAPPIKVRTRCHGTGGMLCVLLIGRQEAQDQCQGQRLETTSLFLLVLQAPCVLFTLPSLKGCVTVRPPSVSLVGQSGYLCAEHSVILVHKGCSCPPAFSRHPGCLS